METKETMSALGIFEATEESFDEAARKIASESSSKTNYLRISEDGTTTVRILPLAPYLDDQGAPILPMERKGYEYPVKDYLLQIEGEDDHGKRKTRYLSVISPKMIYKDLKFDLLDTYMEVAKATCTDKELIDKITGNSYGGGLKYSNQRAMYVYNVDKMTDGMQVLMLSYSQYRDLEDLKMNLWKENNEDGKKHACPISSIGEALPVQIIRKTENRKTSYSFMVGRKARVMPMDEPQVKALLNAPRLPEVLYKYTRYHMEATIEFLKQYDEKNSLNIMNSSEMKEAISVIKACLPADDNSHFTFNKNQTESAEVTLDDLWNQYDALTEAGKNDKSDEGADLRASIRDYVENNDLDIRITRSMTNEDALNAIAELVNPSETEEEKPAKKDKAEEQKSDKEPEQKEDTADDDEQWKDEKDDDEEEARPRPRRR